VEAVLWRVLILTAVLIDAACTPFGVLHVYDRFPGAEAPGYTPSPLRGDIFDVLATN